MPVKPLFNATLLALQHATTAAPATDARAMLTVAERLQLVADFEYLLTRCVC